MFLVLVQNVSTGGTITFGDAVQVPAVIEGQPGTIPLPPTPPTIAKLVPAVGPDTGGTTVDVDGRWITRARGSRLVDDRR